VTLSVRINDDGPVVSGSESRTVDEGDIATLLNVPFLGTFGSNGSSPNDGMADGSETGGPVSSFLSSLLGVKVGGPAYIEGSLAATVDVGADGAHADGGFAFAADAASTMDAIGLMSKDKAVHFTIVGDHLIGYANDGLGAFDGDYQPLFDRTVLVLSLDS